jgi:hypothetical protein
VSNPVEIVIRASDRFSPVFDRLEAAFQRAGASGCRARGALEGLGETFAGFVEEAGAAESALSGFALRAGQQLETLGEERQAALAALATLTEETFAQLTERMAALEEQDAARREAIRSERFQQERQALSGHLAALGALERQAQAQTLAIEQAQLEARLENFRAFSGTVQSLAEGQGGALARLAKGLAIAEALISAYLAGNKALASVPFPLNLAAAAAVTAQGLATVERIRQVHVAHGGLENVAAEGTFLLQRGERVLSPGQNRELSQFLAGTEGRGGGGVVIENLTFHILENATSAEALLAMEQADLRRIVTERIIPALDELARLGIRPQFVESNT